MNGEIYIVTSGTYSNYGIRKVFADRAAADKLVAKLNAKSRYEDAEVEVWPIAAAEWEAQEIAHLWTWLNGRNGDIVREQGHTDIHVEGDEVGEHAESKVEQSGPMLLVRTRGTVDLARQSHSDAIGQARAEIMRLA